MAATTEGSRAVPAPDLREVAQIWWDVDRDPEVRWRDGGRRYELVDPADAGNVLGLAVLADAPADPADFARLLAEGLASCDFPPTGQSASRSRVQATLSAAGRSERLAPAEG